MDTGIVDTSPVVEGLGSTGVSSSSPPGVGDGDGVSPPPSSSPPSIIPPSHSLRQSRYPEALNAQWLHCEALQADHNQLYLHQ